MIVNDFVVELKATVPLPTVEKKLRGLDVVLVACSELVLAQRWFSFEVFKGC